MANRPINPHEVLDCEERYLQAWDDKSTLRPFKIFSQATTGTVAFVLPILPLKQLAANRLARLSYTMPIPTN